MKSFIRRHLYVILLFAELPGYVHAQCGAAPIAAAACSGGNGAATSGVNINSGNTYWVNTTATLASVNLNNGGTLRICGNLTISSLNYNGGNLIVESGGTLNISALGSSNLNGNTVIINRGTMNITSSITFQNSGNYIYNDLTTSVLNIAGTVTVNSGGLTLINRGIMSISSLYYQGAAGTTTTGVCLGPQSVTSIYNLTNVTTNSFTYSGTGAACLNVTGSATLTDALTSSSNIRVCLSGSVTGTGGWGSAVVTTGCSSCATVLPLGVADLTATKQGNSVQLNWLSGVGPAANGIYYAGRSVDGVNFDDFASVDANASGSYAVSDPDMTAPRLYYRVRAVSTGGTIMFSPVVMVEMPNTGQLQLYPNPAAPGTAITLLVPAPAGGQARLSLIDMAGQVVSARAVMLAAGENMLSWGLSDAGAGLYIVRIEMPGGNLYGRLLVAQIHAR